MAPETTRRASSPKDDRGAEPPRTIGFSPCGSTPAGRGCQRTLHTAALPVPEQGGRGRRDRCGRHAVTSAGSRGPPRIRLQDITPSLPTQSRDSARRSVRPALGEREGRAELASARVWADARADVDVGGLSPARKAGAVPVGRGTQRDVSGVAWVGSVLEHFDSLDDGARRRRSASGSAIQIEGQLDDQRLADRIVTVEPPRPSDARARVADRPG